MTLIMISTNKIIPLLQIINKSVNAVVLEKTQIFLRQKGQSLFFSVKILKQMKQLKVTMDNRMNQASKI
jgi:hypothetical protein